MKIHYLALFNLILVTGVSLQADPAPAVVPAPAPDPLTEALPILQAKYVDFAALNYKPGDKLSDLIARSGGKINLTMGDAAAPLPIITATLPEGILYWRLASFALPANKNWPDFAAQVQTMGSNGIVLDLRSNTTPTDYAGAKQILGVLKPVPPPSNGLGTRDDSQSMPLTLPPPIVILTNNQTSGAAEALAGYLQADGALVVGQATAGKVAVFEETKLSSGQVLRFAVAASGADDLLAGFKFRGETPVWGKPVVPDISPTIDEHSEKVALMLIKDGHVQDVIEESPERHRMSEASLVQGQDPEWDDYLTSLEDKPVLLSLPETHDAVLISALDSLKAIRLSERTVPDPAPVDTSAPISTSVQ